MPERGLDSGFWGDKWIRKLEPHARYLFLYLWSNDHCNQAGLFEITLETMSFETGLPESELPKLLEAMKGKVKWLPDEDLIWVKNFIKRQSKSPKFLIAVAKCLTKISNNGLVVEVVEYNRTRHSISIPYPYTTDSVSILTREPASVSSAVSGSGSGEEKEGGGVTALAKEIRTVLLALPHIEDHFAEHEAMKQALADLGQRKGFTVKLEMGTRHGRVDVGWLDPQGEPVAAFEVDIYEPRRKSLAKLRELDCSVSFIILRTNPIPFQWEQDVLLVGLGSEVEGEKAITGEPIPFDEGTAELLRLTRSLKHWRTTPDDEEWLLRFLQEFPEFSREMMTACTDYYSDRPDAKHKGDWKNRLRNWSIKQRQFAQERRQRGQKTGERVTGSRPASDFRGKW